MQRHNDHSEKRPLLKGKFHLLATLMYVLISPTIYDMIPPKIKLSLGIYLLCIISNFGSSAFLHMIPWPDYLVVYPRRLDHTIIFVKIAATYYAIIATVLPDINKLVIDVLNIGTALGILTRLLFTDAPQIVIGISYLLVGWAIMLDPYILVVMMNRIPTGTIIAIAGGLSYTIGALIYTFKYPRLCPKIMGYHELFHIFTIIGTILFTTCIFYHAIPYYTSHYIIN